MKLSKDQIKRHNQAVDYLNKDELTFDEKLFVFENWNEGATNINSSAGAFFTPWGLARDFSIELWDNAKTVDLCAGIGMLSFVAYHYKSCTDITCVEINQQYIEVGKKMLPEAKWIQGSVMDKNLIESLGNFKQAISNPPFGNIKHNEKVDGWLQYTGQKFDLKTIEVASKISENGLFILPQMSTPFRYSGSRDGTILDIENLPNGLKSFVEKTGIQFEFNCGIDTSFYLDDWKGVKPLCEIALFDFTNCTKKSTTNIQPTLFEL